jgi:ATPase family associated with various cellular activities (AAA)
VADRVLIYGVTGSGKTTLAQRVAERTGLPFHSVDDLTWEPGWVEVPADEQRRRIAVPRLDPGMALPLVRGQTGADARVGGRPGRPGGYPADVSGGHP